MSEKLYAKLGQKQERIEELEAAFDFVNRALAGVLDGSIDPERVLVNLTDRAVTVAPPGEGVGTPATINGKPECVIARPVQVQEGFRDDIGPVTIQGRNLVIMRVTVRPELAKALEANGTPE